MKIHIIAGGKEKDFAGQSMVEDYSGRIRHSLPIEWTYIPSSDINNEDKQVVRVLDNYSSDIHVVILDEKGGQYSSMELASFLQKRLNQGIKALIFIIGGAYGVGSEVRARAHSVMSLSMLTFPHQLVRLILAEQIYRALSINKGEKYHHP